MYYFRILLFFSWIAVFAVAPKRVFARPAIEHPFYFEAKSQHVTIYVLGTIHLGVKLGDFPSEIIDNLKEVDSVALEVLKSDPIRFFDIRFQKKEYMALKRMPLSQLLTSQEFRLLERAILNVFPEAQGYQREYANFLNPFLGQIILRSSWMFNHFQRTSLDQEIENVALQMRVRTQHLETPHEMYNLIAPNWQESAIILKALLNMKNSFDEEIESYLTGDETKLDEQLNNLKREFPGVYQSIFAARNGNWTIKLKQMTQLSGRHFVAVGASHLFGENGILSFLQKEGLQVRRWSPSLGFKNNQVIF